MTDERAGVLYVAIFGTCHVLATWLCATQPDPGASPYLMGGACILAWLIFWWFYRRDLRARWGVAGPQWTGHVHYPEEHP